MAARQDANMALANEMAIFCENANVDYFEVLKCRTLSTRIFTRTAMDEKSKNESYLLLESAENINAKLRLPALARQINE